MNKKAIIGNKYGIEITTNVAKWSIISFGKHAKIIIYNIIIKLAIIAS